MGYHISLSIGINPKALKNLRRSTLLKLVIVAVGAIFLAYAAYLRSIEENERIFIAIGIIFIFIGVITFLFGESEEKISQEDNN